MMKVFAYFIISIFLFLFSSCVGFGNQQDGKWINLDSEFITYEGRVDHSIEGVKRLSWSNSGFQIRSTGSECWVKFSKQTNSPLVDYVLLVIDDEIIKKYPVKFQDPIEIHAVAPVEKEFHDFQFIKITEGQLGIVRLEELRISEKAHLQKIPPKKIKIEFIGNSITCGYGVEGADAKCGFTPETENSYWGFAAITARNLKAEQKSICVSGIGIHQNYNKDTILTMSYYYNKTLFGEKIEYQNPTWQPDIVCINLGTNDFAFGNPKEEKWVMKYMAFVEMLHSKYPAAKFVLMSSAMMNDQWPKEKKCKSTLDNYLNSISVLLKMKGITTSVLSMSPQGMVGYGCDWHPNIAQQKINAAELENMIKEML